MAIVAATGRKQLAGLLLFVGVTGLYAPSTGYDFIYDDHVLFVGTPVRHGFDAYAELFHTPHFRHLPYYRPVARTTFELQKSWSGARPGPFHLFNALAAGLLALAAWRLLSLPRLQIREPYAWLAAALFVVHPIASSTIYPVTGRETLLATLLSLVAVAAFLRARAAWDGVALAAFSLALLCHEQAIMVPALLLLADACGLRPVEPSTGLARRLRAHAPFALAALLFLAVRARVLGEAGGIEFAVFDRPNGPPLSLAYAVTSVFAPTFRLAYEPTTEVWAQPARLAVAGVALAGLVVACVRARRQLGARIVFCAGWFGLALLPTANLLMQETTRFAERWLCLASLGIAALLAALLGAARRRARAARQARRARRADRDLRRHEHRARLRPHRRLPLPDTLGRQQPALGAGTRLARRAALRPRRRNRGRGAPARSHRAAAGLRGRAQQHRSAAVDDRATRRGAAAPASRGPAPAA